MNGMAASDKIFKLLDLPEGDARTAEIGTGCAIACRDLHFGYTAEKETLHGLNLDFPQAALRRWWARAAAANRRSLLC